MPSFLTKSQPGVVPSIGSADVSISTQGRRGQQFRNYQLPNLNLALYQLQIRDPNSTNTILDSYIFPLSPESVRKEFNALTNFYDVQGDATNNGVQRVIDIYGHTPPVFMLEGTTGWQLHQTDGYKYTGLQSISRIEGLLSTYAQTNQSQIAAGNQSMAELYFFDFFRNEYWAVVPYGPQGIRQSAARPLYVNYSFRFVGIRDLGSAPPPTTDTLAQTLSTPPAQSSSTLQQFVNDYTSDYAGVTAQAQ